MFLRKKAQSTAEYAITIGLVVAVTAGVLQMALKGGMRQKHQQAMNYMLGAGDEQADGAPKLSDFADQSKAIYTQDFSKTDVTNVVDKSAMKKGGETQAYQAQTTVSESTEVELIDEVEQGGE